jgi:hypothetical protein
MKTTNSLRLAMVIALMSISISSYGEIINLTGTSGECSIDCEYYENDMDLVCNINTNTYQPVTIWYSHEAEGICDYMVIYQIDQNGNETELVYLDGGESGSVTTTLPTGKAKIHIVTDGSVSYADGYTQYAGFYFSWEAVSSHSFSQTQFTNSNATIAGNLGVGISSPATRLHINGPIRGNGTGGALTVSTTYGNVTVGATNSTQATFTTDKSMYIFDKTMRLNNGVLSSGYTNLSLQTYGSTKMTILRSNGNVGIGTETPSQALSVKGNLSLSPSGTTPNEGFKGSLMITKPAASGQYINFVRDGQMPWSIGTVYNSSNFAIGQGKENDAEFSAPPFVITPEGWVGIGEPYPYHKLHVRGTMYLRSDDYDSYPGSVTNHFYWQGHRMMMGTKPGDYCHNIFMLQPGGSDQGELFSNLQLWHATSSTNKDLRISLMSTGNSFFNGGNVGIGTSNPQYLLDVKGIIRATEVKIQSIDQFYADFVFAKDYALPTLKEVDTFIQTNGHLPDVPSAADVKENGINLVEMQVKLLQKVEELTLYTIEQQKLIDQQARIMKLQQERLDALEKSVGQ